MSSSFTYLGLCSFSFLPASQYGSTTAANARHARFVHVITLIWFNWIFYGELYGIKLEWKRVIQACLDYEVKLKVCFYIALYPVRWTAQSALHFTHWQTCSFQPQLRFSRKYSSHDAITREYYSHISATVYSQALVYTAEWTGASWREIYIFAKALQQPLRTGFDVFTIFVPVAFPPGPMGPPQVGMMPMQRLPVQGGFNTN